MHKIICISREFSSGGHEIAEKTAERLGIAFYDHQLLDQAAEKSVVDRKLLEEAEEKAGGFFRYTALYEGDDKELLGKSANDIIYILQKRLLLNIASKEDAIIVGRCADDILQKQGNCLVFSVFITGRYEDRLKRCMQVEGVNEKEAKNMIKKYDKHRKSHYEYYTERDWGKPSNYDVCLNTSSMGIERTVNLLAESFEKFNT